MNVVTVWNVLERSTVSVKLRDSLLAFKRKLNLPFYRRVYVTLTTPNSSSVYGRTAILPPPKVVRCMISPSSPFLPLSPAPFSPFLPFPNPSWLSPGSVCPFPHYDTAWVHGIKQHRVMVVLSLAIFLLQSIALMYYCLSPSGRESVFITPGHSWTIVCDWCIPPCVLAANSTAFSSTIG